MPRRPENSTSRFASRCSAQLSHAEVRPARPWRRTGFPRLALQALALLTAAFALSGCIRKMATITSDPPCARVTVNGTYRGETPVEMPYNWNWFYDMKVEKEGHVPYVIRERFYAPPQHWIPIDFIVELLPIRSPEPQWRHYQLTPDPEED